MGYVNCMSTFNNFRLLTCSLCFKGASTYILPKSTISSFCKLKCDTENQQNLLFCELFIMFAELFIFAVFETENLFGLVFCLTASLITVLQTTVFYFVHSPFLTICQFSLLFMDFSFHISIRLSYTVRPHSTLSLCPGKT